MRIIGGRRLAGIIAVGGAAALIAAGCGGGDNGDLSSEEYIEQADAICADFAGQLNAIETVTEGADYARFLRAVLPLIRAQPDELRALNPPADIEEQVTEMLDSLEEQGDVVEEGINRLEAGAIPEQVAAEVVGPQVATLNDEGQQIADEIGLQECSTAPGATMDRTG